MKWIAVALIVIGIGLLLDGYRRDSKASQDDGSVTVEVLEIFGGGGMVALGFFWLLIIGFFTVTL